MRRIYEPGTPHCYGAEGVTESIDETPSGQIPTNVSLGW